MICDFGMTTSIAPSESIETSHSSHIGTLRYRAHELIPLSRGRPIHTTASDVWAFGMTTYVSLPLKP